MSISSFETRSAPASLGATHRAFTFYLGSPTSSIPDSKYLRELRVLLGEIEDRFGEAAEISTRAACPPQSVVSVVLSL